MTDYPRMTDEERAELKARIIAEGGMRAPGTDKRKKRLNPALMEWAVEDMDRRYGKRA